MIVPKKIISNPAYGVVKEVRPLQVELTEFLERTMQNAAPGIAEAGTGIGKSFAYLTNAIACAQQGKRVLVSTAMKSLQQQLVYKDLPLLTSKVAPNIKFARALGKANYACKRQVYLRVNDRRQRAVMDTFFDTVPQWAWEDAPEKLQAALPVVRGPLAVSYCSGERCAFYDECAKNGYKAAREAIDEADIVVVNHSLIGAEIRTFAQHNVSILGSRPFRHLIVDEAHSFPSKIRESLQYELPQDFFSDYVRKYESVYTEMSTDPAVLMDTADILRHIPESLPMVNALEATYLDMHREAQRTSMLGEAAGRFASTARTALRHMAMYGGPGTAEFVQYLREDSDGSKDCAYGLLARHREITSVMEVLTFLNEYAWKLDTYCNAIDLAMAERLRYVLGVTAERDRRSNTSSAIKIIPLDIAEPLNGHLETAQIVPTYLSATLTTNKNFKHFAEAVGQQSAEKFIAGTPFDYAKQAWAYYPAHLPEAPRASSGEEARRAYIRSLAAECKTLLEANEGHAFILFTAKSDMHDTHAELRRLGYTMPLLIQTDDMKARAREIFLRTPHATLLGLRTFWEGIDVPGLHLSLVIIPKLPFPPPDDPIIKAKSALYPPGKDFAEVMIPHMLIDLRQMVGRLIRSTDDRGVVAVLDSRIHTKRYGSQVIEAIGYPLWGTNPDGAVARLLNITKQRKRALSRAFNDPE